MNFTQMHEHLRLELLRRIKRGQSASPCWLVKPVWPVPSLQFSAQPTSAFAGGHRPCTGRPAYGGWGLLPALHQSAALPEDDERSTIPVVSHASALFEPFIRPSAVQSMLHLPAGILQAIRTRVSNPRRAWERLSPCAFRPRTRCRWSHWCCRRPSRCWIATTLRSHPTARTARTYMPSGTRPPHAALRGFSLEPTGAAAAQHRLPG